MTPATQDIQEPAAAPAPPPAPPKPRYEPRTPPILLVAEPDYMLRRTVALTARSLDLGEVHETSGVAGAENHLNNAHVDGLLLALGDGADGEAGLALLERIRNGLTRCPRELPVAVIVHALDRARATRLRDLGVASIAVRPARAKTLLEALSAIARRAPRQG